MASVPIPLAETRCVLSLSLLGPGMESGPPSTHTARARECGGEGALFELERIR
jgi:hypothetical protein